VSPIAKAASILLVRDSGTPELFLVRRADALRFLGGFWAFPGGKFAASDRDVPLEPQLEAGSVVALAPERYVAAARELFEETGVLLARRPDGSFPASGSVLDYLRRKMAAENLPFPKVLSRLGLTLRAADFVPLGAITTPPFLPTRFDTAFLLARLPSNQNATVWPGELAEGEWATAATMLERWTQGTSLVSPPTVLILEGVRDVPAKVIAPRLVALFGAQVEADFPAIYFSPDVQLIPLHTQALPPSTHTNAYLVGRGPVYLLDPGSARPEEQQRLFTVLDAHQASRPLTAVVLTHHHPDHIGAANACAERYGVPILAHPLTAEKLRSQVRVSGTIEHGDRLDLGTAPGGGPWFLEAVHTPGHAPGHLAFYDPRYRLLFAGDMVSTLSSVVIAPPEGDLAQYLDSLRRLQTYDCRLLLPAHGSPTARPRQVLQEAIAHRVRREGQLLAALDSAPRGVAELAQELYKGLQPSMMRFAELQVEAGLGKLQRDGRVAWAQVGERQGWCKV
jgi:glyoxylase-like metal-dependent hydrolase (beta-lactamase superfamily II)/8-oxo-dGTP pyrophosphatase MutT (NUDIX family)